MNNMKNTKEAFTAEEIATIKSNKYVLDATPTRILYTEEFKEYFIEEYISGVSPTQIFRNAGFDVNMLGKKRIERASARWRETFAVPKMRENREKNPSHRTIHDLFIYAQEEIDRLNKENNQLKADLAKLRKVAV